jgi:transposase-like protein
MATKGTSPGAPARPAEPALVDLACPNPDCCDFNRFAADNLSVVEWTGKHKHIRRLYCSSCGHRFSERRGTLRQYSKRPEATVVRIVKCLRYGCTLEATADICEVDPRTVARILGRGGRRAEDFHRSQMQKRDEPPEAVPLDEWHGRVSPPRPKKGGAVPPLSARPGRGVAPAAPGSMPPGPS